MVPLDLQGTGQRALNPEGCHQPQPQPSASPRAAPGELQGADGAGGAEGQASHLLRAVRPVTSLRGVS